jgi:DNA-binding SARP family transcriptional activator
MEYRILGPLEVVGRDGPVPLRGPRQRALLAFLLVHANEVVAEDRLLEELWGDERPESGSAAIRVRVSQLRKALPGAVFSRRPAGYVLEVGEDELDAARFERLLASGSEALARGEPEAACASLRASLALWRGGALADFAYEPFAQAESGRLEELRVRALEERIEAELALGRHADLVAELETLVDAHPLRERLRGQQMLALYRAGRQAEALAAYREARDVLVGELGLEPSSVLQELERAILRHDAELEPPPTSSPAPVRRPSAAPTERKLVTVLAADLGTSRALRVADPERAEANLVRLHDELVSEVEQAGGRVEAFGGGALTAVFGAPVAQEDHAERALHAALSLRRRLDERFGDEVSLRIGIATGEAVVGEGRPSVGSPVAGAMRFAHGAPSGAVCVGRRAAATARGAFEFGTEEDEQGCRYLLRALSVTSARSGRTPLVGRAGELDALRAAYRRVVRDGRPHLASVVGDAGVGKSRLVWELWDGLPAAKPPPLRRSGRCHPYGRGTTYRPLAEVLREELGLLENDPAETVLDRLRGREPLALTLGLDVVPDLHPLVAREQLHEHWVALLTELAAERPVVVLIEDIHWAQEPLLDLLERIVDEVRGPLLLVGTARPELTAARPAWGRRRDATTIWLEPLADDDARRVLDAAAGELAPELRELVLERAEGNPFFLEEMLAGLHDRASAEPRIPDSIQAVLAARLDLLPPTEKAALQAAAVIGRSFWRGPVRELLDGVAPDFALLESRDFIRRRSGSSLAGEREFAFKHALTREVAYASLPSAARARLHAAFAGWLEGIAEGRGEHAALLAHHLYEAVRPENADLAWARDQDELERLRGTAVLWLRRAAELAIRRYDLDEARVLLERALALEPEAGTQLELWKLMGRANALKHDGEPFLAAMMCALELSPDAATTAELYADLSLETAIRAGMWRQRPARELVDGWIERALELAKPDSSARARALIARCVWNPAGYPDAAREASAIAERLGDPELRSYAFDARGITAWVAGERDLARAWQERRFELIDQISDPDHVADIHYAPITGCVWQCRFDEARRLAGMHDAITRTLTAHHRVHGLAVLVEVEELVGDWSRIHELEQRADVTILANRETPCVRSPRSLLVCALASLHLGDPVRAAVLEEHAESFEMEGYGHVLDTPRLQLALVRGELERVERLLAEPLPDRGWHRAWLLLSTEAARLDALSTLERRAELEAWPVPRRGTYLEPFHQRALGLVREDRGLLDEAVAGFEERRLLWHAEQTRALL